MKHFATNFQKTPTFVKTFFAQNVLKKEEIVKFSGKEDQWSFIDNKLFYENKLVFTSPRPCALLYTVLIKFPFI